MTEYQIKAPIGRVLEVIEGFHQYQGGLGQKLKYKRYEISDNSINWKDDKNSFKIGNLYPNGNGLVSVCLEDSEIPEVAEGQMVLGHILSWINPG